MRFKRIHGLALFSHTIQFSDKRRNKLTWPFIGIPSGKDTIKANIHIFIIMFYPAQVLYEQSNCIDRINICYIRSLTKILLYWYLICDKRRKEHHWKRLDRCSFQLFSNNLTIILDFLKSHDKHNTGTVSVKLAAKRTRKARQIFAFLPVFKARRNEFHIFRQCMYIVYIIGQ
jgi:hypothetical protein